MEIVTCQLREDESHTDVQFLQVCINKIGNVCMRNCSGTFGLSLRGV
jgi:hypothetical protein